MPDQPGAVEDLSKLAFNLYEQGRYAEAQSLHERALAIREKALGPEHLDVAQSLAQTLTSLAELLSRQARYAEAQPLFERALAIWDTNLGPEHETPIAIRQALSTVVNRQSNSTPR
jgi:tetratricopeptide (TPR) repeat protein